MDLEAGGRVAAHEVFGAGLVLVGAGVAREDVRPPLGEAGRGGASRGGAGLGAGAGAGRGDAGFPLDRIFGDILYGLPPAEFDPVVPLVQRGPERHDPSDLAAAAYVALAAQVVDDVLGAEVAAQVVLDRGMTPVARRVLDRDPRPVASVGTHARLRALDADAHGLALLGLTHGGRGGGDGRGGCGRFCDRSGFGLRRGPISAEYDGGHHDRRDECTS
ncbi:hypothetical protein EJK15_56615 [Nonomuraea basaltis]|nr:hypothetical protein EJK15_56615 [Nonomuraea basaltis]